MQYQFVRKIYKLPIENIVNIASLSYNMRKLTINFIYKLFRQTRNKSYMNSTAKSN